MIKFRLPVLEQELVGKEIVSSTKEMVCFLDVSAAAQEVWEREFPVQAKQEGLFDYIERIKEQTSGEKPSISSVVSALKAIYCMIKFEKPMTKDEFLSLFSFTDKQYFNDLVARLLSIFEVVYPEERKNF